LAYNKLATGKFDDLSVILQMVDSHDIRELGIEWLRGQIGLVSQEPVLFDCSIRENIEYGDNSREVTMDEVIAAARMANIHNFVESLPEVVFFQLSYTYFNDFVDILYSTYIFIYIRLLNNHNFPVIVGSLFHLMLLFSQNSYYEI